MEDKSRTVTLQVSQDELRLILTALDLLLMVEDDREAVSELKELLQRLQGRPTVEIR
jgi:hypothetical protein